MGLQSSKTKTKQENVVPFLMDRIISIHPVEIAVGIVGGKTTENPFQHQCIRINQEPIPHSLLSYQEENGKLFYKFDGNVELMLIKNENNIWINLKNNEIDKTFMINDQVRRMYKSVSWNSHEIDKIVEFLK